MTLPIYLNAIKVPWQYSSCEPVGLFTVVATDHCTRVQRQKRELSWPCWRCNREHWWLFLRWRRRSHSLASCGCSRCAANSNWPVLEYSVSITLILDGEDSELSDDYPAVSMGESCTEYSSCACDRHHWIFHALAFTIGYAAGHIVGNRSHPSS